MNTSIKYSFILLLVLLFSSSCATKMGITLKKKEKITHDFSGTFFNNAYKSLSKNGTLMYNHSILDAFNIVQHDVRNVYLEIDKDDVLHISYKDCTDSIQTISFKGKYKRGYYEYYLVNDKVRIPFIYSNVDVERIRIGQSKNANLIIEKFSERSGYIFLFAAGSSSTNQSFHHVFNSK